MASQTHLPSFVPRHMATKPKPLPTSQSGPLTPYPNGNGNGGMRQAGGYTAGSSQQHGGQQQGLAGDTGAESDNESEREILGGGILLRTGPSKAAASSSTAPVPSTSTTTSPSANHIHARSASTTPPIASTGWERARFHRRSTPPQGHGVLRVVNPDKPDVGDEARPTLQARHTSTYSGYSAQSAYSNAPATYLSFPPSPMPAPHTALSGIASPVPRATTSSRPTTPGASGTLRLSRPTTPFKDFNPIDATIPLREFKDSISKARSNAAKAMALAAELEGLTREIEMSPTKRRASGTYGSPGVRDGEGVFRSPPRNASPSPAQPPFHQASQLPSRSTASLVSTLSTSPSTSTSNHRANDRDGRRRKGSQKDRPLVGMEKIRKIREEQARLAKLEAEAAQRGHEAGEGWFDTEDEKMGLATQLAPREDEGGSRRGQMNGGFVDEAQRIQPGDEARASFIHDRAAPDVLDERGASRARREKSVMPALAPPSLMSRESLLQREGERASRDKGPHIQANERPPTNRATTRLSSAGGEGVALGEDSEPPSARLSRLISMYVHETQDGSGSADASRRQSLVTAQTWLVSQAQPCQREHEGKDGQCNATDDANQRKDEVGSTVFEDHPFLVSKPRPDQLPARKEREIVDEDAEEAKASLHLAQPRASTPVPPHIPKNEKQQPPQTAIADEHSQLARARAPSDSSPPTIRLLARAAAGEVKDSPVLPRVRPSGSCGGGEKMLGGIEPLGRLDLTQSKKEEVEEEKPAPTPSGCGAVAPATVKAAASALSMPAAPLTSISYAQLPQGAQPSNPLHVPNPHLHFICAAEDLGTAEHYAEPTIPAPKAEGLASEESNEPLSSVGQSDRDEVQPEEEISWPPKGWDVYITAMTAALEGSRSKRSRGGDSSSLYPVDEFGAISTEERLGYAYGSGLGNVYQHTTGSGFGYAYGSGFGRKMEGPASLGSSVGRHDGRSTGAQNSDVGNREKRVAEEGELIEGFIFDQETLEFVKPVASDTSSPTSIPAPAPPAGDDGVRSDGNLPPVPAIPPLPINPLPSPPPTSNSNQFIVSTSISRVSSTHSTRPPPTNVPSTRPPSVHAPAAKEASTSAPSHMADFDSRAPSGTTELDSRAPSRATTVASQAATMNTANSAAQVRPRTPNKLVKKRSQKDRERQQDKEAKRHERSASVPNVTSGSGGDFPLPPDVPTVPLPMSTPAPQPEQVLSSPSIVSLSHSSKSAAPSSKSTPATSQGPEKKERKWRLSFMRKRSKSVDHPMSGGFEGVGTTEGGSGLRSMSSTKETNAGKEKGKNGKEAPPLPKPILKRPGRFEERYYQGDGSEERLGRDRAVVRGHSRERGRSPSVEGSHSKSWYRSSAASLPASHVRGRNQPPPIQPLSNAQNSAGRSETSARHGRFQEDTNASTLNIDMDLDLDGDDPLMQIGPSTSMTSGAGTSAAGSSASSSTLVPYSLQGVPTADTGRSNELGGRTYAIPDIGGRYHGTPELANRSLPISPLALGSSTGPSRDHFERERGRAGGDDDEAGSPPQDATDKKQRRASLPVSTFRRPVVMSSNKPLGMSTTNTGYPVPGPAPFTRSGLDSITLPIPKASPEGASLVQKAEALSRSSSKASKGDSSKVRNTSTTAGGTTMPTPPSSRPTTPKSTNVPSPFSSGQGYAPPDENSARRTLPGSRSKSPERTVDNKRVSIDAPQLPPLRHLLESKDVPRTSTSRPQTPHTPQMGSRPQTPFMTPVVLSEPPPDQVESRVYPRAQVDILEYTGLAREGATVEKRGSYAMYEALVNIEKEQEVPIEDQRHRQLSSAIPPRAQDLTTQADSDRSHTEDTTQRYVDGLTTITPSNLPPFVPTHVRTSSSPQRISYAYTPAHRRGSRGSVSLLSLSGEGTGSQTSLGLVQVLERRAQGFTQAGGSSAGNGVPAGDVTNSETDSMHSSSMHKGGSTGGSGSGRDRMQSDAMSMLSDSFGTITPRESVFGFGAAGPGGSLVEGGATPRESVYSTATARTVGTIRPNPSGISTNASGMAGIGAGGGRPTSVAHSRSNSRTSRMWKVWSPSSTTQTISPSPSTSSVDVSQSFYTNQSGTRSGRTSAFSSYSNGIAVTNAATGKGGGPSPSRSSSMARGGSGLGAGTSKENEQEKSDQLREKKERGAKLKKKRKIPLFEVISPGFGSKG